VLADVTPDHLIARLVIARLIDDLIAESEAAFAELEPRYLATTPDERRSEEARLERNAASGEHGAAIRRP